MYISGIKLTNIRGFQPDQISFSDSEGRPRARTVIIGRNGTCKTTLLRCIALGICQREDANALLAEDMIGPIITTGENSASIQVEARDSFNGGQRKEFKSDLDRGRGRDVVSKHIPEGEFEDVFITSVSVSRSFYSPKTVRDYNILDSVYSFFNYESGLEEPESILYRLRDFRDDPGDFYQQTINGIKRALGLDESVSIDLGKGGGVFVSGQGIGKKMPLQAVADGYRLSLSWILDIYSWAMRAGAITSDGGIKGIILIDEIEQHLHPSMHLNIVSELSKILPEAQLIVTTHSPLVALGVDPSELISLKRDNDGKIGNVDVPNYRWYSVSDILKDDWLFDAEIFRSEVADTLERYRTLVERPKGELSNDQKAQLSYLGKRIRSSRPAESSSPLARDLLDLMKKYKM